MGTCKYCEKSIPLGNLKSHYKEHSMGPKNNKDVTASKEDSSNVQTSINNEDNVATSKEDKNVQENCISSSSSPSDQMICSEGQENTAENLGLQKEKKSSKNAPEVSESSYGKNIDGESLTNYTTSDLAEKSVASSSQSQSEAENNLTMVIVKRELLDLEDSDLLNIKKEVDPLADDSIVSDQLEGASAKVNIEQSNER